MSASNLNDIASALEKLNISDEQIATIKSKLTDVGGYDNIQNGIGQLVTVLATAREQDKTTLDDLINNEVQIKQLQYVGSGQNGFYISCDEGKQFLGMICISGVNNNTDGQVLYCVIVNTSGVYVQGIDYYNRDIQMITGLSTSNSPKNRIGIYNIENDNRAINKSGATYNCLIFQS